MDLVTSYSSEESQDAALKQANLKMNPTVSDLFRLESDFIRNSEVINKADIDHSKKQFLSTDNLRPSVSPSKPSPTKHVDFLHLESSDSEEEQQQYIHDNINNLLNSAAILNDIVTGPTRPSDLLRVAAEQEHLPSSTGHFGGEGYDLTMTKRSRTYEQSFEPSVSNADLSRKRLKPEPSSGSCSNTAVQPIKSSPYLLKSVVYREEERVVSYLSNTSSRIPSQMTQTYAAHSSVVTALKWCIPRYSHLLLSASADGTLKVWDIFYKSPLQCFYHSLGLKAAEWSVRGEVVITGGYEKRALVYDVLSGINIVSYNIGNYLSCIVMHPTQEDIFLCGTHNEILAFDLRVNSDLPIRRFTSKCDEVLDMAFLDANELACSTSFVSRDSEDRTIMVWDFSSGAILSNQIFLERYTCPTLKVHPSYRSFVAQTNGDYIAEFSSQRPYKLKNKRFIGHKVSGYGIECDISLDGKYIASGDANGDIYFYNYFDTSLLHKLSARNGVATNRLKWHPVLPSTIASSTWDGQIQLWK